MENDSKIRDSIRRVIDVFEKRPETGRSSIAATAVISDGLRVDFTQGEHSAVMDLPETMGGEGIGPTPGFFGRAGIAGCVAMGIKQAAILAELVFDNITVDIENDFDDGAVYGMGTCSAAPLETRLAIRIQTAVPEAEVVALVEHVLQRDPWFLALRDAQVVKPQVIVQR